MSNLSEIVKTFNKIEELRQLINLCEMSMNDAHKAMKIYGEVDELKGIYNRNKDGKEEFENKLMSLVEKLNNLVAQAKQDPNFAQEIEKAEVPSELKKLIGFSEEASSAPKGYEKT